MNKLTIEFVRKEFEKKGYKLLSKEYIGARSKFDYICSNGHLHSIRIDHLRNGVRCPHCYGNVRLTIEFVKKEFEKENYELLINDYKNSKQKLNYICSEGHEHQISWGCWQQGQRCPICYYERMSIEKKGKNNHLYGKCGPLAHNWKGGISCEPYCFEWSHKEFKDFIKERDNYKCLNPDCLNISNRLCVHHIDYNKKNCEPQNLITLCTSCNSRANKDRKWHTAWYQAILNKRYGYEI